MKLYKCDICGECFRPEQGIEAKFEPGISLNSLLRMERQWCVACATRVENLIKNLEEEQ